MEDIIFPLPLPLLIAIAVFAIQIVLCLCVKKIWIKLIPVFLILIFAVTSFLYKNGIIGEPDAIIESWNLVLGEALFTFALILIIADALGWLIYRAIILIKRLRGFENE